MAVKNDLLNRKELYEGNSGTVKPAETDKDTDKKNLYSGIDLSGIKGNTVDLSGIGYNLTDLSGVGYNKGQFGFNAWDRDAESQGMNIALDAIKNQKPFQYDINGDALYQQYKNQYMTQGKLAMNDAMAQASAMTGGYGNSYAAQVGNQAYQGYLQQLNDRIPELYEMAYNKYLNERQDLYNMYGLEKDKYDTYRNEYDRNIQNSLSAFETNQNEEWRSTQTDLEKLGITQKDNQFAADLAIQLANAQQNQNNYLTELELKKAELAQKDNQFAYTANNKAETETTEKDPDKTKDPDEEVVSGSSYTKSELMEKAQQLYQQKPDWLLDSRTLDNWLYNNGIQGAASTLMKGYLQKLGMTSGGYRGPASVILNGTKYQ